MKHALFSSTWRRHTFGVPPEGDFWWNCLQRQATHTTRLDCWRKVFICHSRCTRQLGGGHQRGHAKDPFRSSKIQFLLIPPRRISGSSRSSRRRFYSSRSIDEVTVVCRFCEEIMDYWYSRYFEPTRNEGCRPFHRHSESCGYVDRQRYWTWGRSKTCCFTYPGSWVWRI